jgi:RNA polymerase sigma-70 factor (ECF subfamily)
MSDAKLRAMLEAGDRRRAFDALYAAHAAEVARFVRVRLGAGGDPEDVCQEVWAAVSTGLGRFRFESAARVWILSIARNKTLDAWRRHQAFDTIDSQLARGGPLASLLGIRTAPTPTRELERRRRAEALHAALAQLDAGSRELLELRFVLGLKPAEIATLLGGLDPNTVSQRIVRAARRLRQALGSVEPARAR